MKKLLVVAGVVLVIAASVGLAGCSNSAAPPLPGNAVTIENHGFSPAVGSVKVGDTVTWTNKDSTQHTVTIGDVDSGAIGVGKTYSYKFETAGTYPYYCRYHPSMVATIVVQ
ncbi:MAG: cupredoxin domain-containing protein [Coriobacteriia bacterium]|nr:cupredoxin domain-containing protein [Coriobacteriia bacterium]